MQHLQIQRRKPRVSMSDSKVVPWHVYEKIYDIATYAFKKSL